MPISYPQFFEQLLQRDRSLRSGVDALASTFELWLDSSRLPFFTDYTDHGLTHLNCVLATANNLISPDARALFTPSDAATLISATLFHDSAMHLSEAGFEMLVKGAAANWCVPGFGDASWPTLWDEFLFSARRWDERRLSQVFGNIQDDPSDLRSHLRDPFEDFRNLNQVDRRLIGEFVRIHHARMAHEFSCFGVPGPRLIDVSTVLSSDLRDICGVVARSHGLPVRACLDYLKRHYHRREYKGVHAVYLMALLRVSDYLQIQAERAPAIVFKYRHIPSAQSELEWRTHNAITNITYTHDDPESIEIQATPEDVHVYIRLKEWLSGIQHELDSSWAVLGETFGSHASLSKLGLILRRVRSNLDDVELFSQRTNYVPERIELTVARPDLLRLLVGPLYDNEPAIGIRELMQNAIDAVRERKYLQQKHPELCGKPLLEQAHDVEIWVDAHEGKKQWIVMSDRGVGMTVSVVRDYFLTAGASFRNSDAWKREFEVEGSPHSGVLRSGRFGVGVLAGFLLGSRMEISTRHIRDEKGIRFSTTLDPHPIELRYDDRLRIGTTIRIEASAKVVKALSDAGARVSVPRSYDWYVYSEPSVARFVGPSRKQLEPQFVSDRPLDSSPGVFRKLRAPLPYSVYWTFRPMPSLSVNGIYVTTSRTRGGTGSRSYYSSSLWEDRQAGIEILHPNINIEDPDGVFPLNLRRSDITEREYSFKASLCEDVVLDFMAFLLVNCPDTDSRWRSTPKYVGARIQSQTLVMDVFKISVSRYTADSGGLSFAFGGVRNRAIGNCMCIVFPPTPDCVRPSVHTDRTFFASESSKPAEVWSSNGLAWPKELGQTYVSYLAALEGLKRAEKFLGAGNVKGARLTLPTRIASRVAEPARWVAEMVADPKIPEDERKKLRLAEIEAFVANICEGVSIAEVRPGESVISTPDCPRTEATTHTGPQGSVCILDIFTSPSPSSTSGPSSNLERKWNEIVKRASIPFDLTERRQFLREAYESLDYFVQAHERGCPLVRRK